MFERTFVSFIILVLCGAYSYHCLTITPERVTIKYVNDKYISNVSANVRRSSKRGQYVFNMKLINKTVLGNNVTVRLSDNIIISLKPKHGPALNKDLARIWNTILKNGLPRENKLKLERKHSFLKFHVTIYEHSSRYNQYVRTLMEFHYKWCDLVLRDILFGPILQKYGITECPTLPGPIAVANMSFSGNFPFTVLFDKGKFDIMWKVGSTGEVIGSLDVFVGFGKS